ncbi:histone-like nucleoid-structuring protein Lsr2 [Streptomyces sp. NPDC050585]|uniref:Lsr2 family DNA-binding protein n=1 Tax=Streptomyces sp. NPDC050585 TaxID=3365632 RepID=UPI0037B32173
MTSLSELIELCPPPIEAPAVDWADVENSLRLRLPQDYKDLAAAYGPGAFCDFIRIYHPRSATQWVNLTGPMPATIRAQLQHALDRGTSIPYRPGEMFAIGVTDNGNHLFWIIDEQQEDPNTWCIAVNEARGPRWYTYDGTLTDFLTAVLSGRLHVPMFPHDLLSRGVTFSPSRPASPVHAEGERAETAPQPSGSINTAEVRAWARNQGYDIPERGRIPGAIIVAWRQAHRR